MKELFVFSITSLLGPASKNMSLLHKLCCPLKMEATSKNYYDSETCIRDCIQFVNSQIKEIQQNHTTVIEQNPFLSGTYSDMDEDTLNYHRVRWLDDELFKVHATNIDADVKHFPLTCSIFKTSEATGFLIESNSDTVH